VRRRQFKKVAPEEKRRKNVIATSKAKKTSIFIADVEGI